MSACLVLVVKLHVFNATEGLFLISKVQKCHFNFRYKKYEPRNAKKSLNCVKKNLGIAQFRPIHRVK